MTSPPVASGDVDLTRVAAGAVRSRLVVVLSVTSGATDAIGFLALGSAFTSVMTGNMVLLGVGAAGRDGALVISCCVAILSFVGGAAVGARLAGMPVPGDDVWPRAVSRALQVELGLLLVFAGFWWALGSAAKGDWLFLLLGLNAGALGLQSSAVQRFGVPGLSTTYLTGTLTTVVIRLVAGHRLRTVALPLMILLALVVGAGCGAVLVWSVPAAVPALQLLTLSAVLVTARTSKHLRATASPAGG